MPNPDLVDRGGPYLRADEVDDLAVAGGMDPAHPQASITGHNEETTKPAITGRLHALRVVPGITFTTGGITTDADGRVLDPSGSVLPGLYAAGSCTGGIQGGPRGGYVGGLAVALVFGYRVGAAVASNLGSSELISQKTA